MKRFKKKPNCEICGVREATIFLASTTFQSYTDGSGNVSSTEWEFCCAPCAEVNGYYPVEIRRFFDSPASTVDWIAHLHEKGWKDWDSFADMMLRFRAETKSYSVK